MSCSSAVLVILSTAALMLAMNAAGAEGKRGCVNFGHSCYGGMGKRASDLIDTNEEVLQNVEEVEENPAFVFTGPRSSYKPKPDRLTQQQYDNISRIIRQWMANYRRMQEAPNENMSDYNDENIQIVDIKNLHKILTEDEIHYSDMTSLRTLMLVGQTTSRLSEESSGGADEDTSLQRLSLAYERLHTMPNILVEELAPRVRILDISNNEFESLDFLREFSELTHLICDHNNITSKTVIPYLPKLELLWMNHCKISELYPWARKLLHSCPGLRYLSLMGNPVAPSFFKGWTLFEYLQYRLFIISLFPYLIHLDDKVVTPDERKEAQEMYHRPLMERLVTRTHKNLPPCLREVSERVSELLAPVPAFVVAQKNVVI